MNCADNNDVHISRVVDWDILLFFFENSKYPKLEFSPLNSSDIVSICSDDLGARSKLFLSYVCALSASDSQMIEHLESYTHTLKDQLLCFCLKAHVPSKGQIIHVQL